MFRLVWSAALLAGAIVSSVVPAHADAIRDLTLEPVDGMGVDCGPIAQIKDRPDDQSGRNLAIAGIALSMLAVVIRLLMALTRLGGMALTMLGLN